MKKTDPQINVRVTPHFKRQLEASATANGRTLTGEIIARLKFTFETGYDPAEHEALSERLSRQALANLRAIGPDGRRSDTEDLARRVSDLERRLSEIEQGPKRS